MTTSSRSIVLRIYFSVVAAVTLFTLMFGAIDLLTIGLRNIIPGANEPEWGLERCDLGGSFAQPIAEEPPAKPGETKTDVKEADAPNEEKMRAECEQRNAAAETNWRNQQASNAVRNLALIIVALPLFILHFRIVYRDWNDEREQKTA